MTKYHSTIYKMTDLTNDDGLCYIGSTRRNLDTRLGAHFSSFGRWLNGNGKYCSSFDIIDNGNFKVDTLEEIYCTDVVRYIRERKYIEQNNTVNSNIPSRSHEEWLLDHPNYHKDYYENNKAKLLAYSNARYAKQKAKKQK